MYVVGTAGHVDHGKSSLVRALTGIDPDRLKEEKAREMTIDLGFAWLTLPSGESIGVVDVPGHRDFIENMLAGVGGINAVLFVVAADEGAMPQTREHLAIIDLLRIPTGVIALTKTDLVSDPGWIDLVQLDLAEVMRGTVLDGVPIIPVSVRTGEGLEALKQALADQLMALPAPTDVGQPRLWVDRVFSVSGFGTVVTGTLLDGQLVTGQEIALLPDGLRGRIRGLQSHQQTLETAHPGNRVAVNISGIDKSAVKRGNLLSLPGLITPTKLAAVHFRHLPDAPRPLKHNAEVKFFCGAAETVARVRLLDAEILAPGAEGWLQLELRDPIPLIKGDRFILRSASPAETIGGGEVIDPAAGRRWRRNRPEVIRRLEALARGNPAELVTQAIEAQSTPLTVTQIESKTGLDTETITAALANTNGSVIALDNGWWIGQAALDKLIERLTRILTSFHKTEPLRLGQRPENLRSQLGINASELDVLISAAESRGLVKRTRSSGIALTNHTVQPTKAQQITIDRLMRAFADMPYTPPSPKEAAVVVGEDVLSALIEWGDLIRIGPDVLFTPAVFHEIVTETEKIVAAEGKVTIKTLRDRFNTSRKYAQAILEYFDSLGITRRVGDDHVIGSGDWARLESSAWGKR